MHDAPPEARVKPAAFRYLRPESLEEALAQLGEHADEAKVLAGGQSLVAMMNLRLARPSVIVDINTLPGMSYILPGDEGLRIGALTRHRQLEHYPVPPSGFEVLPAAAQHVGHYPIRARGTFGGSVAHADPAAEWCVLTSLFQADVVASSQQGNRTITADDFFMGMFSTALREDEMVTEVSLRSGFQHTALEEFARRHGDFAVVTAAVGLDVEAGKICRARVVLGGVGDRPHVSEEAATVLTGNAPGPELFAEAGQAAAAVLEPADDIHADANLRRHLSAALVHSALTSAMTTTGEQHV